MLVLVAVLAVLHLLLTGEGALLLLLLVVVTEEGEEGGASSLYFVPPVVRAPRVSSELAKACFNMYSNACPTGGEASTSRQSARPAVSKETRRHMWDI
jgi:hypothetical protein